MPCSSRSWRAVIRNFVTSPSATTDAQRRAQVHTVTVGDLARRTGRPMTPSRVPWYSSGSHGGSSAGGWMHELRPAGQLFPHPLDAPGLDQILEAGAVTIPAVAEVALRRDHGLDHVDHVLGRHPAERLGEQRVGVLLAGVAHAEAAADVDVEPGHRTGQSVVERRHDADVVGEHVDVVVARPGDGDLELPRQVDVAVDRLGRTLATRGPRNGSGAGCAVTPARRRPTAPSTTASAGGSGRRARRPTARRPPGAHRATASP